MPNTEKLMLIHPTRLQIYKIICERPGTYFYRLMSELPKYTDKVSSATLIYHLKKLNEAKLIETAKIDGKRIYYPKKLRDFEAERAYMLLKNENALKIFEYVLNNESPFQNEIARELDVHHDTVYYHTQHLIDAGLISKEKDGKYIRFKISEIGENLLEGSLNIITDEYIRFILSKLADSCHFPEVIEKSTRFLKIRVVCPDEDDIEISIDLSGFELSVSSADLEDDYNND
ncbi:MAG: helix-turn-helix domain-containing protein [Candidatus Lokiarchaeota archaeon]|nr:helix-turn-helix domain-containing protein [Candidatus Lokiarchaeota archaeon]